MGTRRENPCWNRRNIRSSIRRSRERQVILCARVSSFKQKEAGDLERQIELLKKEAPKYTRLIQDVASGLNFQRTGLLALLDAIEAGSVATVVVAYKDRLARFGIQLIERTFRKHQTTLHVVSRDEDVHRSAESELAEDLLAVCNYFVTKNNGRRAAANAQRRREQQNLTSEDESSEGSDDKSESDESETSSSE